MGSQKIDKAQQIVQVGNQKPVVKKTQAQNTKQKGSVWTEKSSAHAKSEIVKGKVKDKKTNKFIEKEYTKLKSLPNGRSLVVDANGKQWVMAHDGVILKQEYVDKNPKLADELNKTPFNKEDLDDSSYYISVTKMTQSIKRKLKRQFGKNSKKKVIF